MAFLTLVIYMSWYIHLDVDIGLPRLESHFRLPVVSWGYYALLTGAVFALIVLLLRRLLTAWKNRSPNAPSA
jgi:hypothetical protein